MLGKNNPRHTGNVVAKRIHKSLLFLVVALVGVNLSACLKTTPSAIPQGGENSAAIARSGMDARFHELYDLLGGRDILGPVISPLFKKYGIEYQYTTAALLTYDPNTNQYSLAPIGQKLGVAEPSTNPAAPGGHDIYEGFLPMYNLLQVTKFVGVPLTDVRYNEARGGIEQYFENLGFFQLKTDAAVHLMDYGAWLCADACSADIPYTGDPELTSELKTPFSEALSRLDPDFAGNPLSQLSLAPDGTQEQIYENIVVIEDPSKPGGIALRPITPMLGVDVDFNTKFDVPPQFHQFIMKNSGYELSGVAVTEFIPQSDGVYRQCFTNMCLDYFPNQPEELQVRPVALGYLYKSRYYDEMPIHDVDSGGSLTLTVSQGYSVVAPNASQIISVHVSENGRPVGGAIPMMTMTIPGVGQRFYTLEGTRPSDGFSMVNLDPIDVPHGTRIDYQVCVTDNSGQQACAEDFFLIWGNP